MKKIICVLFALVMCATMVSVCFAGERAPRLVDEADLLDESGEYALLSRLDEISERQKVDVVIVTVSTTGDKTPMEFADDYYDDNGYGFGDEYDGVLLLVAVDDGECWMSTCGYGITAFTDSDIEYILDNFAEQYGYENYAKAFGEFADICDEYITIAYESEEFDPVFMLVISLVIGFVIAFIVTAVMKGQLKTVRFRSAASDYTKEGSMQVNESRDFFLYSTIARREKPKNNSSGSSTHTSSSGRTHGGGGRSL